jgi:hypothetical protein
MDKSMANRIILTIILCLTFSSIYPQKFHGGFSAGLSATQISGDQLSGFNKAGIFAGAFSNVYLGSKSILQMEINFIQKGSRKTARADKGDLVWYKCNLNYIEATLEYRLILTKRLLLDLGPQLGINMKTDNVEDGFDVNGNALSTDRPPFKRIDFSAIGGLSYNFYKNIYVIGRYSTSIIPVRGEKGHPAQRLDRLQYNSVIIFGLQFEFPNSTSLREDPLIKNKKKMINIETK